MLVRRFLETFTSKIFFSFLAFFFSTNLYADLVINHVIINPSNGDNGVAYFSQNERARYEGIFGAIKFQISATTKQTGAVNTRYWRSTYFRIHNSTWSSAWIQMNHANRDTAGTHTVTHEITTAQVSQIPTIHGAYDVSFIAMNTDTNVSSSIRSPEFTLSNGLVIGDTADISFINSAYKSTNKAVFDCNTIYFGSARVGKINSIHPDVAPNNQQVDISEIYRSRQRDGDNVNNGGPAGDERGRLFRTIALGPLGEPNGTISMFGWYWGEWTTPSTNKYRDPSYVSNNTGVLKYLNLPADFPRATRVGAAGNCWSGGEVNQMSGEIYFSGCEDANLNSAGGQYMIYNPVTNKFVKSGRVQPASASDEVMASTGANYIGSDMAIDAEGNFYSLIYTRQSRYWYLARIVPGTNPSGGDWKYNKVGTIGPVTGPSQASLELWGMAFLNGKLYTTFVDQFYEFDPLSGKTKYKGNFHDNADVRDLATCQVAPIIRGKIYFDANGDGILTPEEKSANGIENITIQLYGGSGNLLSEQTTGGSGEFSFIVPVEHGTATTYYVRVKQPQLNGANIHQTWANGGSYAYNGTLGGTNTVTPVCHNGINQFNNMIISGKYSGQTYKTYDTFCNGARSDGIDGSTDGTILANYYSKIEMTTDRAVAHSDFAFAPSDRSDSPASFKDVSHIVTTNGIFLGKGVSVDNRSKLSPRANEDDFDDGILVKEAENASENFKDLQEYKFQNKKEYTFRVFANSTTDGQIGYLHGWMSLKNSANTTTNDYNDGLKIADGIQIVTNNSSYYDFNYTIPDKAIVNNSNGNQSNAFFRFRYSRNNMSNLNAASPDKGSALANTQPWVIDGEVEDYMATYFYKHIPPKPTGNLTIVNNDFLGSKITNENKNLYMRISGLDFKVKIVYTDENGNLKIPENGLTAKIMLGDKIIKDNLSIVKNIQELEIKDFNLATKDIKFDLKYWLSASSANVVNSTSNSFTVRPSSFKINVEKKSSKLIGGQNQNITILAIDHNENNATKGYNQNFASLITTKTLDKCNGRFKTTEFIEAFPNFNNGTTIGNITYNNVGIIKYDIKDSKWATNNCIQNSSISNTSSGKSGCDIVGNLTLEFIPKEFKGDLSLKNFNDGEFTYLSNNKPMIATADVDISALLANGGVATNYHQGCYSNDINWRLAIENNPDDWKHIQDATNIIKYFEIDSSKAKLDKNSSGSIAIIDTNKDNFEDGIAENLEIGFNFDRTANTPMNPFTIGGKHFNIIQIQDNDTNSSVYKYDNQSNAKFYYGRVYSTNYRGVSPIEATMRYEGYCGIGCNMVTYNSLEASEKNPDEPSWYINSNHGSLMEGNVTSLTPSINDNILITNDASQNIASGKETRPKLELKSGIHPPYDDNININTQSWLLYDSKNANINFNTFKVEFIGDGGGWAGDGQVADGNNTGRVIDKDASNTSQRNIDW